MQAGNARRADFEAALRGSAYHAAWRYAWYLSATREDAEDLLQDALALAFLRHAQLRDPAAFSGWLLSIVRRVHLMRVRDSARRGKVDRPDAGPPERATAMETAPAGLAALPPELAAALLRLPAPQREVLELYYLQELELADTARVLGITAGAAKLRLFRARAALRRMLGEACASGEALASGGCGGDCDGTA